MPSKLPMDSCHDRFRLKVNYHERSHLPYYVDEANHGNKFDEYDENEIILERYSTVYLHLLATEWIFKDWLVGCFGFSGPLRQYFSLYRAVLLYCCFTSTVNI